jgi:hypothetical protein
MSTIACGPLQSCRSAFGRSRSLRLTRLDCPEADAANVSKGSDRKFPKSETNVRFSLGAGKHQCLSLAKGVSKLGEFLPNLSSGTCFSFRRRTKSPQSRALEKTGRRENKSGFCAPAPVISLSRISLCSLGFFASFNRLGESLDEGSWRRERNWDPTFSTARRCAGFRAPRRAFARMMPFAGRTGTDRGYAWPAQDALVISWAGIKGASVVATERLTPKREL